MSLTMPGLEPQAMLRGQIELLTANLGRCRDAISAPVLHLTLPSEVRNRCLAELAEHERDLHRLLARVGSGYGQALLWEGLQAISAELEPRMSEALGLLSGALVRRACLDGGICVIADALLDELSATTHVKWVRLTILGQQESYAQREQIIHLRFPEFTVWALPLAAHEFGHLVAQDLRKLRPDGTYEHLVVTEIHESGLPIPHARELFADIFATYVLGPAYPATAILLRFKPADANVLDDQSTHPSDAKRVHAMIRALRALSTQLHSVDRPYHRVAAILASAWADVVRATGGEPVVDEEVAGQLDYLVDHVFLSLLRENVDGACYRGWPAAYALASALGTGAPPAQTSGLRITDVLNAAWLGRLTRGGERGAVDAIGSDAFALLNRIATSRSSPTVAEVSAG